MVGQKLFEALKTYANKHAETIKLDQTRSIVQWCARDRAAVDENDLEKNYELVRDVVYALWEHWLGTTWEKEVPNLFDFESAFLLLSLRLNYHIDELQRKGGKSLIRETQVQLQFNVNCVAVLYCGIFLIHRDLYI